MAAGLCSPHGPSRAAVLLLRASLLDCTEKSQARGGWSSLGAMTLLDLSSCSMRCHSGPCSAPSPGVSQGKEALTPSGPFSKTCQNEVKAPSVWGI